MLELHGFLREHFDSYRYVVDEDLDTWFEHKFEETLMRLDNSSSIGYSAMNYLGTTAGEILGHNGFDYDPVRLLELKNLVRANIDSILLGVGHCRPINVLSLIHI